MCSAITVLRTGSPRPSATSSRIWRGLTPVKSDARSVRSGVDTVVCPNTCTVNGRRPSTPSGAICSIGASPASRAPDDPRPPLIEPYTNVGGHPQPTGAPRSEPGPKVGPSARCWGGPDCASRIPRKEAGVPALVRAALAFLAGLAILFPGAGSAAAAGTGLQVHHLLPEDGAVLATAPDHVEVMFDQDL